MPRDPARHGEERGGPCPPRIEDAQCQRYPFWTDDGGLTDDSVAFMIGIATESGVLTRPMDAGDVVDRATLNRAVELANQPPGR
ncbi:hypothetical protein CIW49_08415 [Mycolicibacterium sp. P1-18]|nr:hypothetical protein CIW49_08415 [Mycolicibacterium sp. P1-18]